MSMDVERTFELRHRQRPGRWAGDGEVTITDTVEPGYIVTIRFDYYAEALAFTRWYFTSDAPSPESEARWDRLIKMGVEWNQEDNVEGSRAENHVVESPASEEDLVQEGILAEFPRYVVRQTDDYTEKPPTTFWDVFDTKTHKPVVRRSTDASAIQKLADDLNGENKAA